MIPGTQIIGWALLISFAAIIVTGAATTYSLLQDKARYDRGEIEGQWYDKFIEPDAPQLADPFSGARIEAPPPGEIPASQTTTRCQVAFHLSVLLFSGLVLVQIMAVDRVRAQILHGEKR